MDSENSKRSDPDRLLLSLPDKTNFKRSDKYVALSDHSSTIHGKKQIQKISSKVE